MALTIAVPGELIVIVPDAHPDVAWSLPAVSRWKFQVPNRSFCAKAPPRFRKIIRALPPVLSVQVAAIMVLSFDRKPWKVLSSPIPTMPQGNIEKGTLSVDGQGMPFRIKDVMPPIPVLSTTRTACLQPIEPVSVPRRQGHAERLRGAGGRSAGRFEIRVVVHGDENRSGNLSLD